MSETVQQPTAGESGNTCAMGVCEELAAIYRALGHPARLAILKRLAARDEACCGEIVDALPLAQSTVSQHLQVLKDAGLLVCSARGRNCHYQLDWEKLNQAEMYSSDFWAKLNSSRPKNTCQSGQDQAE